MDRYSFARFLGKRAHLGVTGSVAAYKACELARKLAGSGVAFGATLTGSACRFLGPLSLQALGADPVHAGASAELAPEHVFAHLEPGQNAHVLLIVPATANILAKLAHGLADDLLSTQALAFSGPMVLAPAMNPRLWEAPATRANWQTLKSRGCVCLEPGAGSMACGEEGSGRLPEVREIWAHALRALGPGDLSGRKVLVNLGPTREPWDAVRFWSNPSSGRMGAAVAMAAWLRGAHVTAVCGPVQLWLPAAIRRVDVTTAAEMHAACTGLWPEMDVAVCSAAVADFAPLPPEGLDGHKFKKSGAGELSVRFAPTRDILADMGRVKKPGQILAGFAAESRDLEVNARDKLARKGLDLILANPVNQSGVGFAAATNRCTLLDARGRSEQWPDLPKDEVAWRLWDHVALV